MKSFTSLMIACGLAATAALLSPAPVQAASVLGHSVGRLKARPVSPTGPAFSTQCLANFIGPELVDAALLEGGAITIITLSSQTGTQALTQLVMTDSLAGPLSTVTAYLGGLQSFESFGLTALSTQLSGVSLTHLQATLTYLGADRLTTCVETISGSFRPVP
jgi:hypothetical protein